MAENSHRCFHLQVCIRTPEVWAKGNLAVPPHLHRTTPSGLSPASCTTAVQECLHDRSTHRLPSYRRLSLTWRTALLGSVNANNTRIGDPATPFHRREVDGG